MSTREEKSRELLLGIFFNSEEDMTDSIYVSFDGFTFRKIAEAYKDRAPDDREDYWIEGKNGTCLHDPGLIYKDGVFWTMSGFTLRKKAVPKVPPASICTYVGVFQGFDPLEFACKRE